MAVVVTVPKTVYDRFASEYGVEPELLAEFFTARAGVHPSLRPP